VEKKDPLGECHENYQKKPAGDPLTRTENFTIEIHALIHLLHLTSKPILSIR